MRRKLILAFALLAVVAVCAPAQAAEKIIYTFTGGADGGTPYAGLLLGTKGVLYGTTFNGGSLGGGTVFELTPNSNGTWTQQVIYNFGTNSSDGFVPYGGLVSDSTGNLYGTTPVGGTNFFGTVFEVSPQANGTWTEKVLYNFTGGNDGNGPYAGLALDKSGNLFGTTYGGGAQGSGVAFELVNNNGAWSEKILHTFTGANDGGSPYDSSLTFDLAGNLYGTTVQGGAHDYGLIFQLSPASNGTWTEQVVHAFTGGGDGASGIGAVALDNAGNVYAETIYSVKEYSPSSNGTWTSKDLHNFTGGADGASAEGPLTIDATGKLYGMTYTGGLHKGTVFELAQGSNGIWSEKILHKFTGGSDGLFPQFAAVTVDASGNVYGTTPGGGTFNAGVVFQIKP